MNKHLHLYSSVIFQHLIAFVSGIFITIGVLNDKPSNQAVYLFFGILFYMISLCFTYELCRYVKTYNETISENIMLGTTHNIMTQ
jgi:hypothetical protein